MALLFAIALLNPITAIGKANDRERPFRGFASGTITLNVVTGELEGDIGGSATHIGHYTMHVDGSGAFNPDSTFSATGAFSVVTANGDEIWER